MGFIFFLFYVQVRAGLIFFHRRASLLAFEIEGRGRCPAPPYCPVRYLAGDALLEIVQGVLGGNAALADLLLDFDDAVTHIHPLALAHGIELAVGELCAEGLEVKVYNISTWEDVEKVAGELC